MGKSQPSTQKVIQETKLPAWVEKAGQDNYDLAKRLAGQLPGAYQGNLVADLSAYDPAFAYARGLIGSQAGAMTDAQKAAYGAGQYRPDQVTGQSFLGGNVDAYMNPYIKNVEEAALGSMDKAFQRNLNQLGDSAIRSGGGFGSRLGIQEGAAASENADSYANLSANLRKAGYDSATGLMTQDMNRALQADLSNQNAGLTANGQRLQSAALQGQLAQDAQNMQYKDLASMFGMAGMQQGYQQQLLSQDAARWEANKQAMLEPLNLRLAALGMTPYGQSSSQIRDGFSTGTNPLMGALGGAGLGASIFSALGGSGGALGSMGYLLPLLGLFASDERMKTDVQKMGKDPETGVNMYAYRYKGDPKSYPKVVGPMAQEVEKKFPDQVRNVGGRKAVNLGFGPMGKAFQ